MHSAFFSNKLVVSSFSLFAWYRCVHVVSNISHSHYYAISTITALINYNKLFYIWWEIIIWIKSANCVNLYSVSLVYRWWHSYKPDCSYPVACFQGCATLLNTWGPWIIFLLYDLLLHTVSGFKNKGVDSIVWNLYGELLSGYEIYYVMRSISSWPQVNIHNVYHNGNVCIITLFC